MIKNIIFDFGGVVLKHKASLLEDKISEIFSIPFEQASEIWKKEKSPLLTGKVSSEQFLNKLKNELNSDKSRTQLLTEWRGLYMKWADDVDWQLLEFIKSLKKSYRVYLFTDTIDIHDEYNSKRAIYDKFTQVFRSNKEGLAKLDDDAFINVVHKIKATAQECVFIDDLEVNVKRAENLGLKGIIYTNKEELKHELSKLSIETN